MAARDTSRTRARVAAVTEYERPPDLLEVAVPVPEPGAIVVEMDVATVCGSDVHQWTGQYAEVFGLKPPLCAGHEGVGVIAELGPGEASDSVGVPLAPGDRVVWEHENCGRCYECTVLADEVLCRNRRTGMLWSVRDFPHAAATFGTHSYVWPRSGRLRVPDELKSEWASAASCALRTVISGLEKAPPIRSVDTVVVQGAGPLGLFAVAVLSTFAPRNLIVVGAPDSRLDIAREWGATDAISLSDMPDPQERSAFVRELTSGRGGDVVFEFAGAPGAFAEALDLAARNGTVVVVGSAAGPPQPTFAHHVVTKQLTIRGSLSARIGHYAQAMSFMGRYRDRFDWDRMLGRRYRLDQLGDALVAMRSGAEIKPVLCTREFARP